MHQLKEYGFYRYLTMCRSWAAEGLIRHRLGMHMLSEAAPDDPHSGVTPP